jgi:hypothetical protein
VQTTVCAFQELLQIILHTVLNQKDFVLNLDLSQEQATLLQAFLAKGLPAKNLFKHSPAQTSLIYQSAIAHKAAAHLRVSPETIANYITKNVASYTSSPSSTSVNSRGICEVLMNLHIEVTAGYLKWVFLDPAIATWLSSLLLCEFPIVEPLPPKSHPLDPLSPPIFAIQHAHARCCSLLRLAHSTGLLRSPAGEPLHDWQWIDPLAISWLTKDQQLRISHPAERHFISQLCTLFDTLWRHSAPADPISQTQVLQLATHLANAFHGMHQALPIWGSWEIAAADQKSVPDQKSLLADRRLAHLALIGISQRVLGWLLQQHLGIQAFTEL